MPDSLIRISDDIVYRDLDDSVVTLSLTTGAYVGLDPVGSRIWRLIEQDGRKESVRRGVLATFDLDEPTCERELNAFVSVLEAKGLVTVAAATEGVQG